MQKKFVLIVCVFFTQLSFTAHQHIFDPIATARLQHLLGDPAGDDSEIFGKNCQEISELVRFGNADPSLRTRYGLPVISLAAAEKKSDIVEVLLQRKADPNQKSWRGQISLHFVKDSRTAKILVEARAHVNAQNVEGQTPFDKAIEGRKSRELIAFLQAHGAQEGDRNKRAFWNCSEAQALKYQQAR